MTSASSPPSSPPSFASATDAELVRAVVAGDRAEVAAVWDRYARASRQRPRVKLGFGEDVEDLLQDVGRSYFLCHVSGLELGEVACTLGVSSATAKRAVSRARKRLLQLGVSPHVDKAASSKVSESRIVQRDLAESRVERDSTARCSPSGRMFERQ